ncbi:hypothetical protein [Nocardia sp. NPDC019395]|uniref:hypothetical protein n=1 Tax=Nocardia sp. NPDC019395 TaxID=3154686 RepID=UPI0033FBDDC9
MVQGFPLPIPDHHEFSRGYITPLADDPVVDRQSFDMPVVPFSNRVFQIEIPYVGVANIDRFVQGCLGPPVRVVREDMDSSSDQRVLTIAGITYMPLSAIPDLSPTGGIVACDSRSVPEYLFGLVVDRLEPWPPGRENRRALGVSLHFRGDIRSASVHCPDPRYPAFLGIARQPGSIAGDLGDTADIPMEQLSHPGNNAIDSRHGAPPYLVQAAGHGARSRSHTAR